MPRARVTYRSPRPPRPRLEALEPRDVPAGGNVTATLAGGLLTLTGDAADNDFTVKRTLTGVTVTPTFGTTVNGGGAADLPGALTSIKAVLKEGNDRFAIDNATAFVVPGAVTVDLGNGDNELAFDTALKVELGNLTVHAGDGADVVRIVSTPGQNSKVAGTVAVALGPGGSFTGFKDVRLAGPGGVSVSGTGGTNTVLGQDCDVAGTLTADFPNGLILSTFVGGTLGGLSVTGYIGENSLGGTTVTGSVTYTQAAGGISVLDGASVGGNFTNRSTGPTSFTTADVVASSTVGGRVSVRGANSILHVHSGGKFSVAGDVGVSARYTAGVRVTQAELAAGRLSITSGYQSLYTQEKDTLPGLSKLALAGNMSLTSTGLATVDQSDGTARVGTPATPGSLFISGQTGSTLLQAPGAATEVWKDTVLKSSTGSSLVQAKGAALTIHGNFKASGAGGLLGGVNASFDTTLPSVVEGSVTVTGCPWSDWFEATSKFQVGKDVTLNLGGGRNDVTLGDAAGVLAIGGKVAISTGGGLDDVTFDRVTVAGATSVQTGAGGDTLTVDRGSVFGGAVTANLGAGDDRIDIAQNAGFAGPTRFLAPVTIFGGAGNDALRLGVTLVLWARAEFLVAGNLVDGGAGLNAFDDEAGQFAGITLGTGLLNWTDPT